jgi:hypothetical protein
MEKEVLERIYDAYLSSNVSNYMVRLLRTIINNCTLQWFNN